MSFAHRIITHPRTWFFVVRRKELKQQKARFSSQLDEAHKNVHQLEAKVGDMQGKIQKLEQELSLKQWNVESKWNIFNKIQ